MGILVAAAVFSAFLQYFLCHSRWGRWVLPLLLIAFLYWQFGMPHPESLCGVGGGVALLLFISGCVGMAAGWIAGLVHRP